MNLGRKIAIAKAAIVSITRHDDAPLADRIQAVESLNECLSVEMQSASERDTVRRSKALTDPPHE